MKITVPTLVLDEVRCRRNIHRMVTKAAEAGLVFRPHAKTHQSHTVGQWFREAGVSRITVSSLSMARYFADDGWQDITVAFPVNILEIDTINDLVQRIERLHLVVENSESIAFLAGAAAAPVTLWIKIDAGYHRTGIPAADTAAIDQLIADIQSAEHLRMGGFLAHAGHSYQARNTEEIAAIHEQYLQELFQLRQHYADHPEWQISVGDTPTCSRMDQFGVANEIRPGNFVFYDLTQHFISSCTLDDIAVAIACPIVALHPEREEIILYGGGVHFAKDVLDHPDWGKCYGLAVERTGHSWGAPIPGVYLKKLSQEHGTLHAPRAFIDQQNIGDLVYVLPVHSCMAANLYAEYQLTEGQRIKRFV